MATLRDARLARQKTLKEVAEAVGTDVGNLSRIESGQVPKRELAARLVEYFGGAITFETFYETRAAASNDVRSKAA